MVIDEGLIQPLEDESRTVARRRKNFNFHKVDEDPLQRMLNVLQPDSYVQPHKHERPDKREAFVLLKGRLLVVLFDNGGHITESVVLDREKGVYGYEVGVARFHMIMALEENTVVYEVKDGPYRPADDKNFAEWAPAEGEYENAQAYMRAVKQKVTGQQGL